MRQLVILVAVLGCGSKGGAALGSAPDWSAKKLVPQEGTVEGIAFTIDVPDGLPRDKRQPGDWEDPAPELDSAPKVYTSTIEVARVPSLERAKYHGTLDARAKTWVRETARPDGWSLTVADPDKTNIEAITYRQAGDTLFIKCKAVQRAEGPLPSYAKTLAMLETICDSIKPKS